ncbi:homeobox KN domain-containing protein [Chytriomyces cf. hyalinus JEL632]|nr:homeobox KN domain-containing protein [Chytriomyces cf. hyalinus JEL632]
MQEPVYTVSSEHCDALHALSLVAIDLLQSERRASVAVVETVPLVHAFTPLSWYQGFFAERPTESAESADTLSETSEHDLVLAEEMSPSMDASDAPTISATALDAAPSPANSLKRHVSQESFSGVKRHCGATHAIPSISASISTKHRSKMSQQQLPTLKVQIPRRQSTDSSLNAINYYDLDAATPPGTRSPSIPPSPTFSVYYPSSPAEATLAFQAASSSSRRLSSVSSTSSSALAPASPRLKSRANFNQAVLEILTGWLEDHKEDPYPSVEQKKMLADQCGLNMKQVNNWFINARRRRLV